MAIPCNHTVMVTLSSDSAHTVPGESDFRRRFSLGLAVAWVLTHLWHASPLPYQLERVTGFALYGNVSQERGLLVGFALCLAFVLFEPRRLRIPGWVDAVLALVAAVAGSSVLWNYENINANYTDPDNSTLTVAALGLVMLWLAALRVFGWLGAALILLVLTVHLVPPAMGYPSPPHLHTLSGFIKSHWLSSESIFGLLLGIFAVESFFLVMLAVGLDVLGLGRPVASWALRALRSKADVGRLVADHRLVPRLWALAVLFYILLPGLPFDAEYKWLLGWVTPLLAGLVIYAACLAIGTQALSPEKVPSDSKLSFIASGMLVAAALALDALIKFAVIAVAIVFSDFSLDLPPLAMPVVWFLAFALTSVLLAILAGRRSLVVTAFLPMMLYFWLTVVERSSPNLSGFFAVLLLLLVMIEHCFRVARAEGETSVAVPSLFLRRAFLPLCFGQARIMVRVVVFVAILGMLLPWTLQLVHLLTY